MDRHIAAVPLPAPDDGVDVEGVDLDTTAAAPGALRGDQGRPAAQEGVEHDIAAGRAVEDGVGDQRNRLHRRVQGR